MHERVPAFAFDFVVVAAAAVAEIVHDCRIQPVVVAVATAVQQQNSAKQMI